MSMNEDQQEILLELQNNQIELLGKAVDLFENQI